MTRWQLLTRNLSFHWRSNLAVLVGMAVGTAVLAGALFVGDSLRGSLRARAERQLGYLDYAMITGRFFRDQLAEEIAEELAKEGRLKIATAIVLRATARFTPADQPTRLTGNVTVWGVDNQLHIRPAGLDPVDPFDPDDPYTVAISQRLADSLGVKVGDVLTLSVQKASDIPRETVLGTRDSADTVRDLTIPIGQILPDNDPASLFSLTPSTTPPHNVFVSLEWLQEAIGQVGRANALLFQGGQKKALERALEATLTLEDWGLFLRTPTTRLNTLFARLDQDGDGELKISEYDGYIGRQIARQLAPKGSRIITYESAKQWFAQRDYLALESRQLLLEPAVVQAAQALAQEQRLRYAGTFTYMANSIEHASGQYAYAVVVGVDPQATAPLGPFAPPGEPPLAEDEIVLADWPSNIIKGRPGDPVKLTFFLPEQEGRLRVGQQTLKLRAMLPLADARLDPDLTPEYPGITDQRELSDWTPPFPFERSKFKFPDDEYWRDYRTTPKAYLPLATAQKLWGSRFGAMTAIRFAPPEGKTADDLAEAFARDLSRRLDPVLGGFIIDPVRDRLLKASAGGTDFGGLFLGFSFFLIAAALLLVGLLFRLNIERRASEVGLLLATGYPLKHVRSLLLGEGLILALVGGVLGVVLALAYTSGLLALLGWLWPTDAARTLLSVHVHPLSVLIGYVASVLVGALAVLWAVGLLNRFTPVRLLAGQIDPTRDAPTRRSGKLQGLIIALLGVGLAVALLLAGQSVRDPDMQSLTFFGAGGWLLIGGLAVVWLWLHRTSKTRTLARGAAGVRQLGDRNARRQPVRSLLTAGLLAAAAFMLVAVEVFRRPPDQDFTKPTGGSGGFALIARSDVPIYDDLNSDQAHKTILDRIRDQQLNAPDSPEAKQARIEQMQQLLRETRIYQLRLQPGDDASCTNLYRPNRPRLVGVPDSLIERGGFQFVAIAPDASPAEQANPWLLLNKQLPDGAVPIFGEMNSLTYMLKVGLGGTLTIPDEAGNPTKLRVVGVLRNSIFQSELVCSEQQFVKLYPRQEGYGLFLIQPPAGEGQTEAVRDLLQAGLAGQGFIAQPTSEILRGALAIIHAYLSMFQVLGSLGLLLGIVGLAVVLTRNVLERRGEFALLRALGYRLNTLSALVVAENALLLLVGLGLGVVAALVAVGPHLASGDGAIPWLRVGGLVLAELLVGLLVIRLAARSVAKAPVIESLRQE
jgi:putative ABC transport system permease protein